MNNNLKNYTSEPDPMVWEKVHHTLSKGVIRRQMWTAAAGIAIVAAAITAVVAWPNDVEEKNVAVVNMPTSSVQEEAENVVSADVVEMVDDFAVVNDNEPARRVAAAEAQASSATVVAGANELVVPVKESNPIVDAPVVKANVETKSVAVAPQVKDEAPAVVPTLDSKSKASEVAAKEEKKVKSVNTNIQDTILWIPNAFAPASGEEELTIFKARINKAGESVSNFKMVIFNRGGHQVFTSHDINYGWDGTYKGRALPQASYVYVISYSDKDGIQHNRKGTVTLVR